MPIVRLTIPIRDFSCGGGGSLTLERALSKVHGVSSAYVNPATEIATIDCDPDVVPVDVLLRKVRLAGFGTGIPHSTGNVGTRPPDRSEEESRTSPSTAGT
jgi:copper chaperone CopZ